MALDAAGHKMNVLAEEGDEFVFVSAWDNVEEVSEAHRYICYDAVGEQLARGYYHPRGNAVDLIAKAFNCTEKEAVGFLADTKYHEQLRKIVTVSGGAWLKTDKATRKTGVAFRGADFGFDGLDADDPHDYRSFRAALRVKKA